MADPKVISEVTPAQERHPILSMVHENISIPRSAKRRTGGWKSGFKQPAPISQKRLEDFGRVMLTVKI